MNRHPIDATALIFGLLFALSGVAIVSDEAWPELDTTALSGAAIGVIGVVVVGVLVSRQVRGSDPVDVAAPDPDDTSADDDASPTEETVSF
ncbi:MAG: hypothetical protein AAGA37_02840 [Actinomycetota bacterium]